MTLIELLVASALALSMLGMTINTTIQTQRLFRTDSARLRLNQNLRSTLDLLGIGLRQAGERLPEEFPAIEVINGIAGSPDQLILRRHLLDESVTLCQSIAAGQTATSLALNNTSTSASPACTYGGQSVAFASYAEYRQANNNRVRLYIFDRNTGDGEYVDYANEFNTGGTMSLGIESHRFQHAYVAENSSVYVLNEVAYTLLPGTDGLIQVVEDGAVDQPQNITYGMNGFQVRVYLQDGTIVDTFGHDEAWSQIESLEVTLSGSETVKDSTITNVLSSRFYPRNVLSL